MLLPFGREGQRRRRMSIMSATRHTAAHGKSAPGKVEIHDPVWSALRKEAEAAMAAEPALTGFIYATVMSHDRLEDSICHRIAQRLDHADVDAGLIVQTFHDVLASQPDLGPRVSRRSRGRARPRSGLHALSRAAALLQGLPRARDPSLRARAVAPGAQGLRALSAEPVVAHLRRRHPSRGAARQGADARSRDGLRRRRDGRPSATTARSCTR